MVERADLTCTTWERFTGSADPGTHYSDLHIERLSAT